MTEPNKPRIDNPDQIGDRLRREAESIATGNDTHRIPQAVEVLDLLNEQRSADDPLTGTKVIDWLSATTKMTTYTTKTGTSVDVEHTARFAVNPDALVDMLADYSKTVAFSPRFLTADWRNGKLFRTRLTGPQRLKSGEVSDVQSRHRTFGADREEMPEALAAALTTYERKIAIARVSDETKTAIEGRQ
ncbi:hypothetical protein PBI_THONKO_63 [Mycobacterium phage Thonko]|uniref:Uncharacterized protein n=1 Tax=Mycobacterium phage Thonko TaxID=2282910 RepID=A0A346FCB0_9CAUD|nr:hypothetical protein I5G57_gp063 [Mycobacterium phage Thonko]AXN53335.1 hypothetical protein PBI_THONKO_63 [Mycobacterium phage Thonko]